MKSLQTPDSAETLEFTGIPAASTDLITLLDRTLPHKCITQTQNEAEARYYAAQRDLIDYLMVLLEMQRTGDGDPSVESVIKTIKR